MYQIKDDTPRLAHQMSVCFPSFALGHKHCKLEVTHSIHFFFQVFVLVRSSRFITTLPSAAKTLAASNLYLKMFPKSRVNRRSPRFPRSLKPCNFKGKGLDWDSED